MPSPWIMRALAGELPGKSLDSLAPSERSDVWTVGPDSRDGWDDEVTAFVASCPCQLDPTPSDWDGDTEGRCVRCNRSEGEAR